MSEFLVLLSFLAALYIIVKYRGYRKALQGIQEHPGYRVLISPKSMLSEISVPISRIMLGNGWAIRDKYNALEKFGWDVYSTVCAWPTPQVFIYIANPDTLNFPKDLASYSMLDVFGTNIVVSNDDIWKRHRKVAAPAFTERGHKFVWDESIHTTLGLFQDIGGYRSCLGRKFFETEAVAALTLFASRYTIELKEEPQFAGETLEEKKARILKPWQDITLKMRIPLVFKSRH